MRSKLTSNPTRVIHKPNRHPKNIATPIPTAMGASAPERAATALASVIEAGPASPWWSNRNALAPTMIEEPKNEAMKVPAIVTEVPPGAVYKRTPAVKPATENVMNRSRPNFKISRAAISPAMIPPKDKAITWKLAMVREVPCSSLTRAWLELKA